MHHVVLTAQDWAGNSSQRVVDILVDLTQPTLTTIDPLDVDANSDGYADRRFRPAFFDIVYRMEDFGSGIDSAGIECVTITNEGRDREGVAPASLTTGQFTCPLTNLPEGDVEVEASVADRAGHRTVLKSKFTVDTTEPAVSFFDPGSEPFVPHWPWLQFDVLDANPGSTSCTLTDEVTGAVVHQDDDCDGYRTGPDDADACDPNDPSTAGDCKRTFVIPHVLEKSGSYRATVTHTDAAGNTGSASIPFIVDNEAPEIAIGEEGVQFTAESFFDIAAVITDANLAEVRCQIVGSGSDPNAGCGDSLCGSGSDPNAGCGDTVCSTEPDVACGDSICYLSRDEMKNENWNFGCRVNNLPEGPHRFLLTAVDKAGNTASSFFDVFVDLTPPTLTTADTRDKDCDDADPAAIPDTCVRKSSFDIDYSLADSGSGVDLDSAMCKITSANGTPVVAPAKGINSPNLLIRCEVGGAPDGRIEVDLEVKDNAGHVTVLKSLFTVDGTNPEVEFFDPGSDPFIPWPWPPLRFSVDDANPGQTRCAVESASTGEQLFVDEDCDDFRGSAGEICDSADSSTPDCQRTIVFPHVLDSDGGKRVRAIHTDLAGNEGEAIYEFVSDSTAPEIVAPAGPQISGDPDFDLTFEVSDANLAEVQCSTVSSTRDPDTPCGDTLCTTEPNAACGDSVCEFVLDDTRSVDDGEIKTFVFRCQLDGLPEGLHRFQVGASDKAGNVSTRYIDVLVDTTAPRIATIGGADEDCDGLADGTEIPDTCFRPAFFDIFVEVVDANLGIVACSVQATGDADCAKGGGDCNDGMDACDPPDNDCDGIGDLDGDGMPEFRCHVSSASEGPLRVVVTATDKAGNTASSFFDVFVDLTPPTLTTTDTRDEDCDDADPAAIPDTCVRKSSFDIDYFVDDPGGSGFDPSVQAVVIITGLTPLGSSLNTQLSVAPGHFTIPLQGLDEGDYEIEVRVPDRAGNVAVHKSLYTADATSPDVEFFDPGSEPFVPHWPWLQFDVLDANPGSTSCALTDEVTGAVVHRDDDCDDYRAGPDDADACDPSDPSTAGDCKRTFVIPHVLEKSGSYRATVTHTDAAGNTGSASIPFIVDNEAPEIAIVLPTGRYFKAPPPVTFRFADENPHLTHFVLRSLANGRVIEVGDCDDDDPTVSPCELAGDPYSELLLRSFNWQQVPGPDGPYRIEVQGTDRAGNSGSASFDFIVGNDPPVIALPFTGVQYVNDHRFVWDSQVDLGSNATGGVLVRCGVATGAGAAAGAAAVCGGPGGDDDCDGADMIFTCVADNLAEGLNHITMTATDEAGNVGTAAFDVVVDKTAPRVLAPRAPINVNTASAVFPFTVEEANPVAVRCEILPEVDDEVLVVFENCGDGSGGGSGGQMSCTSGVCELEVSPGTSLPDGAYRLHVVATDAAGNSDDLTHHFTVDNEAPTVGFQVVGHDLDTSQAATFATPDPVVDIVLSEPAQTECALAQQASDGTVPIHDNDFQPCDGRFTPGPNDAGVYCLAVRASDAAGNAGESRLCYRFDLGQGLGLSVLSPQPGAVVSCVNDPATGTMPLPIQYNLAAPFVPGGAVVSAAVNGGPAKRLALDPTQTVQSDTIDLDCDNLSDGETAVLSFVTIKIEIGVIEYHSLPITIDNNEPAV